MYVCLGESCIKWHSNESQFALSLAALIDKLILALGQKWMGGIARNRDKWIPGHRVTLHWPSGPKVSTPSQTEVLGESERTTSIPGILFGSSVCLAVKSNFDLIRSIHQLATGRCPNFYSNWQVSWPDQQQSVNAGGAPWFTTFLFWFFFFWCFLSPSWLIDGRFSVTTVLINVWSSGICLFVRPGKECEGGQLLIVVKRF